MFIDKIEPYHRSQGGIQNVTYTFWEDAQDPAKKKKKKKKSFVWTKFYNAWLKQELSLNPEDFLHCT